MMPNLWNQEITLTEPVWHIINRVEKTDIYQIGKTWQSLSTNAENFNGSESSKITAKNYSKNISKSHQVIQEVTK